ncbi:MAG TPA: hypothetical protein EYP90_08080, partial [Chromatiaceae bacterium]|nr:hypothetical protein [Chromatiaceae bacterium]
MSALIVFFLLLAGAVTAAVLTRYRPRLIPAAAVLLSGLSLLLWLIVRTQLPIPSPLAPSSLTYVWRIDEPAWLITAWLLLLLFALALGHLQRAESGPPLMMFAFLLLAFTLPALWADSVYSLIWGLVLLVIPWLAAVWHNVIPDVRRYLAYITMLITAVLLLFYTAASVPASGGWEMAGWPGDQPLAKVGLVRLKLGIMPLLSGELKVAEMTAESVTLNLVSNAKGEGNWQFGEAQEQDKAKEEDDGDGPVVRLESIEDLDLSDIALHFRDEKLGKDISFRLARMQGHAVEGEPFSLSFSGDLEGKPYRFDFTGGSLTDLRGKKVNWPVKLEGTLVKTPVVLEGELIREGNNQLKADLKIGKVDAGATLAWLKVIKGLRMTVGGLTAELLLEGKDLTE